MLLFVLCWVAADCVISYVVLLFMCCVAYDPYDASGGAVDADLSTQGW